MSISPKEALKRLQSKGCRLTGSRRNLIQFILTRPGHWSIQNLTPDIRKSFPGVGIATIYRTVHLLLENELLIENRIGTSAARYEVAPTHHHDHLTCVQCGEIFEFENDRIEQLQKQVATNLRFQLIDHRMELYGHCKRPHCKNLKT